MNKLELIERLKERAGITKIEAKAIIALFFDKMAEALADGDRIEIRGLGSFKVKSYEAYTGRNPKSGENISVPTKKLPYFKCGKELKQRVDY
ncbi:HU family DNA-binding protein [Thermodesulfobacteriota bacterium]